MPAFRPFTGVRYDLGALGTHLDAVIAPPYDVIDADERTRLEHRDPHNAVRLILPTGNEPYASAAADLAMWRRDEILRPDKEPALYAYRMRFQDDYGAEQTTTGVVGALALEAESANGRILPHERTLPKAKSDRLELLRATRANLDPIWVLSLASGLSELVTAGEPVAGCTDDDGVRHELDQITDPDRVAAISAAVASAPAIVADGHHRFETACRYRDEGGGFGSDSIMALAVELAEDQLCVRPIHRLLHGLPPAVDVRRALGVGFDVVDAGSNTTRSVERLTARMLTERALGLVDSIGLALLRLRNEVAGTTLVDVPPQVRDVDATIFDRVVLPLLSTLEVDYRHDSAAVAALVERGVADAAVLLRPVSVAQTRASALAEVRMPQKTTFFWPKPRTGLVFRFLDLDG